MKKDRISSSISKRTSDVATNKNERDSFTAELRKTQQRLDQVSPTFCVAKWKQVTLHLQNGQTHSCHHPVPHDIPLDELEISSAALHNTQQKERARKELLLGKKTKECSYCWNVEDSSSESISDRLLKSNEPWAKPFIEKIKTANADIDTVPAYLELSFSNKCNFKCSYCDPRSSSKWHDEIEKFGPYELANGPFNDLSFFPTTLPEDKNPYIKAFWDWFPKIYKSLRVLRITGGEPLLSESTQKLLAYIAQNPSPKLELSINTNLGVPKNILEAFVQTLKSLEATKAVKKIVVYTSVDSWGKQAEYIRYGLNFKHFWANLQLILSSTSKTSVTIMSTFNVLSVPNFHELLVQVLSLKRLTTYRNAARLHIDISYLRHPEFMGIRLINKELRKELDKCLTFMKGNEIFNHRPGFHPQETEKLARIHKMTSRSLGEKKRRELLKSLFQFVEEHDRRRKTHFSVTFPEIIESLYKNMDVKE
jgi:organic radical activating enzyme